MSPVNPRPGRPDDESTVQITRPVTSGPMVLPLDPALASTDPWQLLATGDGMLVERLDGPPPGSTAWGPPLKAASVFAKQLTEVADRFNTGADVTAGVRAFRLQLPTGYGVRHLARAHGGGFHGFVHGSAGIAGQAVLQPIGFASRLVGVGPRLGAMAFLVVAEYVAAQEQDRKITAILDGVKHMQAHLEMQTNAQLHTAEQAIRQAYAALLDQARIPEGVGLGTAMSNLQTVRNQSVSMLKGWERTVADLDDGPVDGARLRGALGVVGMTGWDGFPAAVRTAYLSISLDARRTALLAAEAQLSNPDQPLSNLTAAVESDLTERAAELDRLRALLGDLAMRPLTVSAWGLPHAVSEGAMENARTQALFAGLSRTLQPAPAAAEANVVHAEIRANGEVQLLTAGEPAAGR